MARYTQADLDRVDRMILQPLTVESGGDRTTMQDLVKLRALRREIAEEIDRAAGTPVHRVSYATFRRD